MAAPRRDFCRSDVKECRGGINGRNLETKHTNQKRKRQEVRSLALLLLFFLIIVTIDERQEELWQKRTLDGSSADTSARESRTLFLLINSLPVLRIFPDLASFRISFPNFLTSAEHFKLVRIRRDVFFFFTV